MTNVASLRGRWVALDNCRYDRQTREPVEGDVVDSDADLATLCGRMRESGRSSCAIVFVDDDVETERIPAVAPSRPGRELRH